MKEWENWMSLHKASFVEQGQPLGSTKRVTSGKVSDVRNDLTLVWNSPGRITRGGGKLFADSPHLQIPQAYIEVMEITDMSEM